MTNDANGKTWIEIDGVRYEAQVNGRYTDRDFDNRDSKTITLEMTHEQAAALFVDGLAWSIYHEEYHTNVDPETGEETTETTAETYDNSEYCIAGPITDNRDGTVSVKMGKPTELEVQAATLAETEAALDDAYAIIYGGV